jgi:hypothetical protein
VPARRRPWGLLFEVDISTSAAAGADPVAAARAAEALGFDFVSANDHPAAHDLRDETWTMLAWIAPATSRIRVATRVLGSPTATRRWWPRSPRPSSGSRVGGSSLGWGWRLGRGVPRLRARGPLPAGQDRRARGGRPRHPRPLDRARLSASPAATTGPRGPSWRPGRTIPSPSGWEPSAAAAWISPGGWPTGGSRRWRLPYQTRRRSCVTASCRQRAAGRDPQHITCAYNLEVGWRTRQAEIRRWSRDPRMWWPSDCSGSCGSAYRDEPPPGRSRNPGAA